MEYKRFRVRSSVKTFRDLEVYQSAIKLSAEVYSQKLPLKISRNSAAKEEFEQLKKLTKEIPELIMESYNDKFSNLKIASDKLMRAVSLINEMVVKIDFLNALSVNVDFREKMLVILKTYQRTKIRIINLEKAWRRVFGERKV